MLRQNKTFKSVFHGIRRIVIRTNYSENLRPMDNINKRPQGPVVVTQWRSAVADKLSEPVFESSQRQL